MLSRIITTAKGELLPFISDVFLTNDPIKHSKSKMPGYGLVLYAETTKGIMYAADDFVGRENNEKEEEKGPIAVQSRNLDDIQTGGGGNKRGEFQLFPEGDEEENEGKKGKRQKMSVDEDQPQFNKKTGGVGAGSIITSPEELGIRVARMLLREISTQSRVDSVFQYLVLGLMALSPRDVSSVVLGPITPFTVQFLRDLKTFFGVTFKVENYKEKKVKKVVENEGDEEVEEEDDDSEDEDRNSPQLHKLTCLGSGYINLNKTTV